MTNGEQKAVGQGVEEVRRDACACCDRQQTEETAS